MFKPTFHVDFQASEDGKILCHKSLGWGLCKVDYQGKVRFNRDGKTIYASAPRLVWSAFNSDTSRYFHYYDGDKTNVSLSNITPNAFYERENRYDMAEQLMRNPDNKKEAIERYGQDFVDDVLNNKKYSDLILTHTTKSHIEYELRQDTSLIKIYERFPFHDPKRIKRYYDSLKLKLKRQEQEQEDERPFFTSMDVIGFDTD